MFRKYFARQLAHPAGLVGRTFIARWLNKANAQMNQVMLAQLALAPDDRILEVGFGGGDLLEKILSANVADYAAGVDRSADMVRVVSRRLQSHISDGKAAVKFGDVELLPYPAAEFTKVCSVNTLYFWSDPAVALAECRRVLRRGGRLLLCFNSKKDLEAWPIHRHGFRLYELAELEGLLSAAGFSSITVVSVADKDQGLFYCVSGMAG